MQNANTGYSVYYPCISSIIKSLEKQKTGDGKWQTEFLTLCIHAFHMTWEYFSQNSREYFPTPCIVLTKMWQK